MTVKAKTCFISTTPTENGIALTPTKYNRGDRFVGTVVMKDVTFKDGKAFGTLLGEYVESYPLDTKCLPGPIVKQMRPLSETVKSAKVLYASGNSFLILP